MKFRLSFFVLASLGFLSQFDDAFAIDERAVEGQIIDSETSEPLAGANIYVEDTYKGTNTNPEGEFELVVETYPVILVISYVGYESKSIELTEPADELIIELEPGKVMMDELVVTDEDPADQIMRRVIEHKKNWQAELKSWKAEAYTRQNLYNEEGIVSITESYSNSWWHHEKGAREVLTDQQQTNNLLADDNFAATSYLPNFYDDHIEISGFDLIGVTHPDALDYYDFRIEEQNQLENDIIYKISVEPKNRLQPLFKGDISVSGSEYALLDVSLTPGDAVFFPPPVNSASFEYTQSFNNYGQDFWLPANVNIEGTFLLGIPGFQFPEIRMTQAASIKNYQVNIPVPDSLYEEDQMIQRDITSISQSHKFEQQSQRIPLSGEEKRAYETIDSTLTLEKAYEPSGFLTRFISSSSEDGMLSVGPGIDTEDDGFGFSLNADARFNRVESLYFGVRPEVRLSEGWIIEGLAGYNTGQENWAYGGRAQYHSNQFKFDMGYKYSARQRISSDNFGRVLNSAAPLLGYDDYFDYYQNEQFDGGFRYSPGGINLDADIRFTHERQQSLVKSSNYSLPGGYIQRENPAIEDGNLNALQFEFNYGDLPAPFGIAGSNNFSFTVEHSDQDLLQSDFDFTRFEADLDLRINTFLQRRLMPNTLDLRLRGFSSSGRLPVQRYMGMDGSLVGLTPFGTFKSARNRQIEGEHGAALFWEHNFRTVPLELLGLQNSRLVEDGVGIILSGGHGRTWIDDNQLSEDHSELFYDDQWRHEIGVSVNNLFRVLRFDTTYRIDEPGLYFGISLTRFF